MFEVTALIESVGLQTKQVSELNYNRGNLPLKTRPICHFKDASLISCIRLLHLKPFNLMYRCYLHHCPSAE